MANEVVTSKQFTVNWRDILKGLLMAVIGAALSPVLESLEVGNWVIDWKHVAAGAITAGVAYLMKNFFTPSKTVIKLDPPLKEGAKVIVDGKVETNE